jgi:hypothetical protein
MARLIAAANWDDNAPHLTEFARAALWQSIPPYQRDARTKGVPQLGAGVILPFPDEELLVDPFKIPDHWPRGYGLDVGWNRTAAIWRTYDPDAEPRVNYLIDEYYGSHADPTIHGVVIAKRGKWIPGRIDPAARGRSQADGKKLLNLYRKAIYGDEDLSAGVRLLGIANNAVESGLLEVWNQMNLGLLKVFRNRLPNWMAERRLYRRDERGVIVKKFDHAQDACRYNIASGDTWLMVRPKVELVDPMQRFTRGTGAAGDLSWMGNM